jgi:hypothetical protein
MWKWVGSLADFAMTNVRVIRDAWGAFIIWCLIAVGICWWGLGYLYEFRLTNASSQISTLTSRMTVLAGERDDLQKRLAERPTPAPSAYSAREPDGLYQFGSPAASAPGGVLDRPAGLARFPRVIGGPNFNIQSDMDYRQFTLSGCQHGSFGSQATMGVVVQQFFSDVVCHISGLHP